MHRNQGWNAFLPEGEVNVAVGYQEVVQKLLPAYGGGRAVPDVSDGKHVPFGIENALDAGTDAVAQWQKLMSELKPMSDAPRRTAEGRTWASKHVRLDRVLESQCAKGEFDYITSFVLGTFGPFSSACHRELDAALTFGTDMSRLCTMPLPLVPCEMIRGLR